MEGCEGMTEKEAMEIIMQVAYDGEFPLNSNEAFGIACNCIAKQIPKKPLNIEDKYWGCPCCYGLLMVRWITYPTNPVPLEAGRNYCEDCGQKIDWEEVE